MQRIMSLPRRYYRGTITKLKTRQYMRIDDGINVAFLAFVLISSTLVLRELNSEGTCTPFNSCQTVCYAKEAITTVQMIQQSNDSKAIICRKQCELDLVCKVPDQKQELPLQDLQFTRSESLVVRVLILVVAIISFFVHNIKSTIKKQICLASPQRVTWQTVVFRQLPLKFVTKVAGKIFSFHLPYPLNIVIMKCFTWIMEVDMSEARDTRVSHYHSILQIFTRKLKEDVRPVDANYEIVCPADSKLIHIGGVTDEGVVEQVKGVTYSLKTFLGRGLFPKCREGHSLYSAVFYLAPRDYHHFHSPTEWNPDLCRHFKGDLITVSPWAIRCIPGLFALNERVLLSGQWKHGFFSMTAVGALNVGSIHVNICKDLVTNFGNEDYHYSSYTDRRLSPSTNLAKGEYAGGFKMGSTIVLIFEAPDNFRFVVETGQKVKYGQAFGTVS